MIHCQVVEISQFEMEIIKFYVCSTCRGVLESLIAVYDCGTQLGGL